LAEYSDMNKPHLFSIIQHWFSLIQVVTVTCMLQVPACTETIFRHVNTKTYEGRCSKNLRGLIFTVTIFILLKHKIHNIIVLDQNNFKMYILKSFITFTSSCVVVRCEHHSTTTTTLNSTLAHILEMDSTKEFYKRVFYT